MYYIPIAAEPGEQPQGTTCEALARACTANKVDPNGFAGCLAVYNCTYVYIPIYPGCLCLYLSLSSLPGARVRGACTPASAVAAPRCSTCTDAAHTCTELQSIQIPSSDVELSASARRLFVRRCVRVYTARVCEHTACAFRIRRADESLH